MTPPTNPDPQGPPALPTHLAEAINLLREVGDQPRVDWVLVGGALSEIQTHGYIGDHGDFWSFVEAEFGIRSRKAHALVQIHQKVLESGASWDEATKIGWSKLMLIASRLTPENWKEWFEKARTLGMRVLQQEVKAAKA